MEEVKPDRTWPSVLALFKSPNQPIRYSTWGLSVLAILAIAYLVFTLSFLNKVYPRVTIGGQNFAGLSATATQAKVQQLTDNLKTTTVTLLSGDHSQKIVPSDITWQVDVAATAAAVYNYGRDDNRWRSF